LYLLTPMVFYDSVASLTILVNKLGGIVEPSTI
jgi:hypothetical protein